MLPRSLSEDLCSLARGKDRFVFSVIVRLQRDGTIAEGPHAVRFTPSVIRSRGKLAYENAQLALDAARAARRAPRKWAGKAETIVAAEADEPAMVPHGDQQLAWQFWVR